MTMPSPPNQANLGYDAPVSPLLPPVRIPHPHIVIDAHGSPVVEGSRIPVRRLYLWHRDRIATATMLKRYPQLGPARLFDALAFAYDNLDLVVADLERERAAFESRDRDAAPAQAQDKQLALTPPLSSKQQAQASREAQLALPLFKKKPE
jgi:uncharacterized protein (DUF433 family)